MAEVQTNLQVIKRSRTRPQEGDIFAMQLPDERYLFGQVVLAEPDPAPMPRSYLIYVYRHRSASKEPDIDTLTPDQLLLPPLFINRMPWTSGYFQNVAHRPLGRKDRLRQHCFRSAAFECYFDEHRNKLSSPVEPCGDWGLVSYRWLDDRVSDALGIPRIPEDEQ